MLGSLSNPIAFLMIMLASLVVAITVRVVSALRSHCGLPLVQHHACCYG